MEAMILLPRDSNEPRRWTRFAARVMLGMA